MVSIPHRKDYCFSSNAKKLDDIVKDQLDLQDFESLIIGKIDVFIYDVPCEGVVVPGA
jgi:hypothetical protein